MHCTGKCPRCQFRTVESRRAREIEEETHTAARRAWRAAGRPPHQPQRAFHPDHRNFPVPTDGAPLPAVSRFVSGHGQHDPFLSRSFRPIHRPPRFRNDLPSATCSLETCSLPWPARIPNSRPRPCSTARTYPLYLVCGSPTLASVRNVGLPPYHRGTVSIVPFPCSFPGVTMTRHHAGSFRPYVRLVEHS